MKRNEFFGTLFGIGFGSKIKIPEKKLESKPKNEVGGYSCMPFYYSCSFDLTNDGSIRGSIIRYTKNRTKPQ